ncbi:hypothetical protein OAH18_00655 [bacterium]|nr:hypothetical protein [bacterium]
MSLILDLTEFFLEFIYVLPGRSAALQRLQVLDDDDDLGGQQRDDVSAEP